MRSLEDEIRAGRLEISSDTISMSISELTNLYREGTLQIRPEFQRLYRWTNEQKSRLIESILLGIPLPSLFVAQSESGKWELVDGLQRVSTLLELQGVLNGADGRPLPALELEETSYLPSLAGVGWDGGKVGAFSDAQKLDVRLSRIDVKVIQRGSGTSAKYDLFQRLNSFGSTLTAQEVRSAVIAGTNSECLAFLTNLAADENFQACVRLSDRLVDEQYDIELVLRFLMLHNRPEDAARLSDFSTRLDLWSTELASEPSRWDPLAFTFLRTFDWLNQHGGELVFRKYDRTRREFRGGFLNTSFEVVGLGTGFHMSLGNKVRPDVLEAAQEMWEHQAMNTRFATGLATQDRLLRTLPLGRRLMDAAAPPDPAEIKAILG